MAFPLKKFEKDPDANLDYLQDWSEFLNEDTIVDAEWILPIDPEDATIIEKTDEGITPTSTVVWLRGGTVGKKYLVTCRITTAAGRIDDRTIQLAIKEK